MKIRNKLKNKRGITLIALVITIVVLLILAGVTITTLTGNNGILTKANEAKKETEEAQEKEGIRLALSVAQIGNNSYQELNQINLQNALDEQFGKGKTTVIDNGNKNFTVSFHESERSYNITASGEINQSEIKMANTISAEDYGAYVINYSPKSSITSNVGWRIFHSDGTNVFLIADNYIETTDLPSSIKNGEKTGNKPIVGNLVKTAAFTDNILKDYIEAESITSEYKWLEQYNSRTDIYGIVNNNIKSTAYMLDTIAWSEFANDKAEYAVGAPTLELFVASYNVKHSDTPIYTQATSSTGYQIKGGPLAKEDYVDAMGIGSETEDLWVIESKNEAYGMWLASPSNLSDDNNMYIYYAGYITTAEYYNQWLGFRPIICLKSDTQLIKHENATGKISYSIL